MIPVTPADLADLMDGIGVWWAVAGGWAIDLWLGEQTRDHHDIEVVIRWADQAAVHAALEEQWDLQCIDPLGSGWRTWDGRPVAPPAFQLQASADRGSFDLFTEAVEHGTWRFRRDDRVARPVGEVTTLATSGIPVVRPEVQLLYMATSGEAKHEHDARVAWPRLDRSAADWLTAALRLIQPEHPWLASR